MVLKQFLVFININYLLIITDLCLLKPMQLRTSKLILIMFLCIFIVFRKQVIFYYGEGRYTICIPWFYGFNGFIGFTYHLH